VKRRLGLRARRVGDRCFDIGCPDDGREPGTARGDAFLDAAQHARRQGPVFQVMQGGQLKNVGIGLDRVGKNPGAGAGRQWTPRQADLQRQLGRALLFRRRAAAEVHLEFPVVEMPPHFAGVPSVPRQREGIEVRLLE